MSLSVNKYLKWYFNLIDYRISNPYVGVDKEKHHIFPVSIFGKSDLVVCLSAREHIFAHSLLWKLYKSINGVIHPTTKKMALAYSYMRHTNPIFRSRKSSLIRIAAREANIGSNNAFYGKRHTDDTKLKISKANTGRRHSTETINKISKTLQETKPMCDLIWIYNDEKQLRVTNNELDYYVNNGYKIGIPKHVIYKTKMTIAIRHPSKNVPKTQSHIDKLKKLRWMKHEETGKIIRVTSDMDVNELMMRGYVWGLIFKDSESRSKKISDSLKGRSKTTEHITKINKNPEKIRKTAEKHKGMKRSEECKNNISKSMMGRMPSNKGKKKAYTITCNTVWVEPSIIDNLNELFSANIYSICSNGIERKLFKTKEIPLGWERCKK